MERDITNDPVLGDCPGKNWASKTRKRLKPAMGKMQAQAQSQVDDREIRGNSLFDESAR